MVGTLMILHTGLQTITKKEHRCAGGGSGQGY